MNRSSLPGCSRTFTTKVPRSALHISPSSGGRRGKGKGHGARDDRFFGRAGIITGRYNKTRILEGMKSLQMSQVFAAQHFSARSKIAIGIGIGIEFLAECFDFDTDSDPDLDYHGSSV
jgi:hypothetical protein